MSASADLQQIITGHLKWGGGLRVSVPVVARRLKSLASDIEAASANQGLCIFVMPPLPTRAMQGVPFVFFEAAEVRVRIIERPPINNKGADAYDLIDDVCNTLHWQRFAQILTHPLQLASRPTERIFEDKSLLTIDVLFEAVYGFDSDAVSDADGSGSDSMNRQTGSFTIPSGEDTFDISFNPSFESVPAFADVNIVVPEGQPAIAVRNIVRHTDKLTVSLDTVTPASGYVANWFAFLS